MGEEGKAWTRPFRCSSLGKVPLESKGAQKLTGCQPGALRQRGIRAKDSEPRPKPSPLLFCYEVPAISSL